MTDRTRTGPCAWLARFCRDASGGVAVVFAVTATTLIAFMGAGLDLSRAYVARQQLSNVAELTCQYSARPEVIQTAYGTGSDPIQTYVTQVNTFATQALGKQNFTQTQTTSSPFSYSGYGGTASVTLSSSVPTLFLPIVGINSLPVGVTQSCAAGQTQNTQPSGTVIFSESFENSACSGTCWSSFEPNGTRQSFISTPVSTFPSNFGYVGVGGTEWTIMGYCLEIDSSGVIRSTSADGDHAAELDCDNGSGTAGVSSISHKQYYATGTYELRYYYSGRIAYPDYDPAYICGSTASDVSWANDTNATAGSATNVLRTNQVGVYFDADQNGAAPTHVSSVSGVTLAGSNLIDVCVESTGWIERSVIINVTTPGYYWLSFAADGANTSYGADIDAIQVCVTACSGSVQDNFPSAWTSTPLLFEDSFESPATTGSTVNASETLDSDYGASSAGWPAQTSHGWATGPYDQVGIVRALADAGSQSLELDSYKSSSQSTSRRSVSQYFYLDPGYYQITYDYRSAFKFSTSYVASGVYCTYAPSTSGALASYSSVSSTPGTNQITSSSTSEPKNVNAVALFMSHSMEASYPVGGGGLNTTTSYYNPSGTTTTTPTVAPDSFSTSSYNTAQVNPILDFCNYSSSWTTRTTYVQITKPGQYWLTIGAAESSNKQIGGLVDDVKITALNSLYGSAPSFSVTIPTPSTAPGGTINFTGFNITADRLTP